MILHEQLTGIPFLLNRKTISRKYKGTIFRKVSTNTKPYQDQSTGKKQQVEQMFDNIASTYDFLNRLLSMGIDKTWRKRAIRILRRHESSSVLDVATGTGDLAMEIWHKVKPKRIAGIDLSENMLDLAREKAEAKKYPIEFQKGDAENLPFADNTFDAATVAFGVRNFENLGKGLADIHRVLEPGGKLVVLEFSRPKVFPVKQVFQFYFHGILPLIGKLFSKDQRAYSYLPESVGVFPEGSDFTRELEEAGFQNTTFDPLTFGICTIYTGTK